MKNVLAVAVSLLALAGVASAEAPVLTPDQAKVLTSELNRFGQDLALSDAQKGALKPVFEKQMAQIKELNSMTGLTDAEKATKYKDIRAQGYDQIKQILSPEQLAKWDAEAAKAKEFLGAKVIK